MRATLSGERKSMGSEMRREKESEVGVEHSVTLCIEAVLHDGKGRERE